MAAKEEAALLKSDELPLQVEKVSLSNAPFAVQPAQRILQDKKQFELIHRLSKKSGFHVMVTYNLALLPSELLKFLGEQGECTSWNNLQSESRKRLNGFVDWLAFLEWREGPVFSPSVVCVQEAIDPLLRPILHDLLTKKDYVTDESISLLNRKDEVHEMIPTMQVYDGGLAIYVKKEKWKPIRAGKEIFRDRVGLDRFCNKGFMWLFTEDLSTKKTHLFVCCHPQAYMDPSTVLQHSPKDDNEKGKEKGNEKKGGATSTELVLAHPELLMALALVQLDFEGRSFVDVVDEVHVKQLVQMSLSIYGHVVPDFLQLTALKWDAEKSLLPPPHLGDHYAAGKRELSSIMFFGDFNINRWNVKPMSAEETDPHKALANGKTSPQFKTMLKCLLANQPPIVRSPLQPWDSTSVNGVFQDLFTWNGELNWMAGSQESPSQHLWIDYILYSGISCFQPPAYIDNHVEPIPLSPFPDLSSLWGETCVQVRKADLLKEANGQAQKMNATVEERLKLGQEQLARLLQKFNVYLVEKAMPIWKNVKQATDDDSVKPPVIKAWIKYVQSADFGESSQIWKGFSYYGFSKENLSALQRKALPTYVGQPHAFRMLRHASDHFAVSARVLF